MARIDTHIAVWLYTGESSNFSEAALETIESEKTLIASPFVELEITYLFEIGKLKHNGATVLNALVNRGLTVSPIELPVLISTANILSWTRDPFDRLITADAISGKDTLITRDRNIRSNYRHTIW
jgi:PIN domain nuclease of toxin-antitoxin system